MKTLNLNEAEAVDKADLISRVIELEAAIKWLVNEKLKLFGDLQYGKGKMRNILENGSLPVIESQKGD